MTFNVTLDTDTIDGGGTVIIDDALIGPNALVPLADATVLIEFGGLTFDTSFSPTSENFVFDADGAEIIELIDTIGDTIDIEAGSSFIFIRLAEGAVPGALSTLNFPGGELTGTFNIERASAVVPLPSALPLALLAFGVLGAAARFRAG